MSVYKFSKSIGAFKKMLRNWEQHFENYEGNHLIKLEMYPLKDSSVNIQLTVIDPENMNIVFEDIPQPCFQEFTEEDKTTGFIPLDRTITSYETVDSIKNICSLAFGKIGRSSNEDMADIVIVVKSETEIYIYYMFHFDASKGTSFGGQIIPDFSEVIKIIKDNETCNNEDEGIIEEGVLDTTDPHSVDELVDKLYKQLKKNVDPKTLDVPKDKFDILITDLKPGVRCALEEFFGDNGNYDVIPMITFENDHDVTNEGIGTEEITPEQ